MQSAPSKKKKKNSGKQPSIQSANGSLVLAHRSTLQLVSWPCFQAGQKVNPYLAKVVPRGLAPTRSWTWEVGSSQLFRAAFVRKGQAIGKFVVWL